MYGKTLTMLKRLRGNKKKNDEDQLAKCILSFAQIFGHWSFTSNSSSLSQLNSTPITIRDYLRPTFNIVMVSICIYINLCSNKLISYDNLSTMRFYFGLWTAMIYIVNTMSNILLSIWNRGKLFKILSINQIFETQVND